MKLNVADYDHQLQGSYPNKTALSTSQFQSYKYFQRQPNMSEIYCIPDIISYIDLYYYILTFSGEIALK